MDGNRHPEVFYKISALEILNFTRIIQCLLLRSLEFACGRFCLVGGQDSGLSSGSSWLSSDFLGL